MTREEEYNGYVIMCDLYTVDRGTYIMKRKQYIIMHEIPMSTIIKNGRMWHDDMLHSSTCVGYPVFRVLKDAKTFIDSGLKSQII